MGLASRVAEAVSEGVNNLCVLLAWNDAGAVGAPPVDGATLKRTMEALAEAMQEALSGGQIVGAESMITEEARARVVLLQASIGAWRSIGPLSAEWVTLADACVSALWGGVSWRQLMANAPRK
jgi:hypothetical protein